MSQSPEKILVTGASGFIGGHVCEALARRGKSVRAMARRSSDVSQLDGVPVDLVHADLGDPASLDRACQGVDTVIHTAAAVGSFGEWDHFYETGVLGTQRLIEAAVKNGVPRFIHLSSIAAYGLKDHRRRVDETTPYDRRPQAWNHYVREKVMSEQILWKAHEERKIQATSVRPSVVIGARDRNAIPRLVDLLRLPVTALPGRPNMRFPVVCIDDCVDAVVRAVEEDVSIGRAYNVSGESPISLADFFGLIAKHSHLPPPRLYLPTSVMIPAVGMLEGAWKLLKRPGEPVATRIAIVVSGYDYEIDCSKTRADLGWRPKDDYEAAVVAALRTPSKVKPGSLSA
ncbi:MAG: NAD-dependent epimerase/dehydratase family protein [Polyangiaceae bacterium]